MSELVTDYMERAVSLRTRLGMWLHLLQCDACRRYFDQVHRTVRLLGSRHPAAPDQAAEDGMTTMTREARRRDS